MLQEKFADDLAITSMANASRAIAIGMVLGAYKGVDSIRKDWLYSLDQYEYCENLLMKLPLLR